MVSSLWCCLLRFLFISAHAQHGKQPKAKKQELTNQIRPRTFLIPIKIVSMSGTGYQKHCNNNKILLSASAQAHIIFFYYLQAERTFIGMEMKLGA